MASSGHEEPCSSSSIPASCPSGGGSVIADKHARGEWVQHTSGRDPPPERYPTDREVVRAVQQQVAHSVETYRNYRHVAWCTAFVALYLLALHSQAASFKAGDVVATIKAAVLPDSGSPHLAFSSADQVLAWLGNKLVRPIYTDPICGDGRCEVPWEGPAWGPFGCQADCGVHPNTTKVVVALNADFTGHPAISPAALRQQVTWNLCLRDELRTQRGLPPLCWFKADQAFSASVETQIRAVSLIDGDWHLRLDGDLAGKVVGAVYDASAGESELVPIPLSRPWEACKTTKRRRVPVGSGLATRRLLSEFTLARRLSSEAGEQLLTQAVTAAVAALPADA